MNADDPLIVASPGILGLIKPFESAFPSAGDFQGYYHHCLRMLNVILLLSRNEPDRQQKVEIALAFHDLCVFPRRTLDYLGASARLAGNHLANVGRTEWIEPVELMIRMHHKITPYRGPHANLVEAMRKADWIDVSFGALRFGIPRDWVQKLHRALPLHSFYPRTLVPLIVRHVVSHPTRPLPNFRW